jgi:acylphosphatase
MANEERVHATISGRVQGVSFRDATRQEAERLGLTGWVRNTGDGNVEAVFEGDPDAVNQMVEWCKSGPSSADVEDVSTEKETPSGDPQSFEVC